MNLGESKQEQERAVSNSRKKWQRYHITSYIIISPSPSLSHFLSKDHNAKLFKFSAPNPNEKSKAGSYSNPDTGSSGWASVCFVQGVYMLPWFLGGIRFFFPTTAPKLTVWLQKNPVIISTRQLFSKKSPLRDQLYPSLSCQSWFAHKGSPFDPTHEAIPIPVMVSVGVFCGGFFRVVSISFIIFYGPRATLLSPASDGMFNPSQDLGYYNDGIFDFGDVKISK